MKAEARVIGFDDSPFARADGRVPVVGVHMRAGLYVEGVLATDVARDGAGRVACGDRARGALASAPSRACGAPSGGCAS